MERSRDDVLFAALESLRPAPAPAFAAELDARVAAGFPRRRTAAAPVATAPWRRLAARVRALRPRQLLFAGGATALATIAIATVVVAGSDPGSRGPVAPRTDTKSPAPGRAVHDEGERLSLFAAPGGSGGASGQSSSSSSAGGGASSNEYEAVAPATASGEGESAGAFEPFSRQVGPYAAHAHHRDVHRDAQVVLGTDPDQVSDAAGQILTAVHQYDGIVLSSALRSGSENDPRALFELLIPSAKLSDALASFSAVAEVRYRHEGSDDITAPTISTSERLQDSNARIESLLNQLADSETETEREAVEAQLRSERARAADLKSELSRLQRHASLAPVSVRIESDARSSSGGSGGWGAGNALGDAGHILAVAAGVAIVALAVLGPLALIALLIWLGNRAWVRNRRQRALG